MPNRARRRLSAETYYDSATKFMHSARTMRARGYLAIMQDCVKNARIATRRGRQYQYGTAPHLCR